MKSYLKTALTVALGCLAAAAQLEAGAIVVSGDGNIVDGLDGLQPNDNDVFFENVLQGGTDVRIYSGGLGVILEWDTTMNDFYNSLGGVTSTLGAGAITAADLAGVDLLVSLEPDVAYTSDEIDAMAAFVDGGGTLFFLGENAGFPLENATINAALEGLGSVLRIVAPGVVDSGFQTATPGNGQVLANPLTTGVETFVYGAPSGVSGGDALFLQTDLVTPFVAVEQRGVIPEPSSLALGALGFLAALSATRRRARRTA